MILILLLPTTIVKIGTKTSKDMSKSKLELLFRLSIDSRIVQREIKLNIFTFFDRTISIKHLILKMYVEIRNKR